MCLTKNYNLSEKFLKHKRKHNFIYAYKVLSLQNTDTDGFPVADKFLESIYYQMRYKQGYNKADIPNLSYIPISAIVVFPVTDIVLNGIHVYLTRQEAEKNRFMSYHRVVKVKCFIHDFLGKDATEKAAFSKVFVSKAEYQKAIAPCLGTLTNPLRLFP